jgi:MFS family permease
MAKSATNPWVVLVLICFAQFMVILDATIVNVALPSIQRDLNLSEGEPAVDRERVHARVRRIPAPRRPRR